MLSASPVSRSRRAVTLLATPHGGRARSEMTRGIKVLLKAPLTLLVARGWGGRVPFSWPIAERRNKKRKKEKNDKVGTKTALNEL